MFKTILIIVFVGIVNSANLPSNLPNIDICDLPCTLEANHPICILDGETYKLLNNECDYKKQKCINAYNEKFIRVPVSECFKRTINLGFCSFPCPDILSPVCGYNGQTYQKFENACLMTKQACTERHFWIASKMDNCVEEINKRAKCLEICPLNYEPVCGYDGFNYTVFANKCNLDLANCNNSSKWSQVRMSICNERLSLKLDLTEEEKLEKDCPKFCTRIFLPVCGSDDEKHKIFSNECLLRKERCEKNLKWHRVIMSECLFRGQHN